MHDVTLFVSVRSQMTRYIQFIHFQCHSDHRQRFFWRNMDSAIAENIENMPLEMIIWPWIRISECALNVLFAYVAYIVLLRDGFHIGLAIGPRSPVLAFGCALGQYYYFKGHIFNIFGNCTIHISSKEALAMIIVTLKVNELYVPCHLWTNGNK